jgi:hypothetical protein
VGNAITPVTLVGSGGVGGPYTFSATGLPPGLAISPSGTISGTPTTSGTYPYTVTVKDSAGNTGMVNCSITVNSGPIAFSGLSSHSITYGTSPQTLTGTVAAGTLHPPQGEAITVTINGNSQTTTIKDSLGNFSIPYVSATIPGSTTPYPVTYSYPGDTNFTPKSDSSTTLTVTPAPNATTTTVASGTNPSIYPQNVTFTATVTGQFQAVPGGLVSFIATSGNTTVTLCSSVHLTVGTTSSTASCSTNTLTVGNYTITATYVDDNNYMGGSFGTVPQVVQDYSVAVASSPANGVQLVQGYQMGQPSFTSYQQTVTLGVTPLSSSPAYGSPLTATCAVTAVTQPVTNPPTCVVNNNNPITSGNYASVPVTITAGTTSAPSTPGIYTLKVTTQDGVGLPHSTNSLTFYVVEQSASIAVVPGQIKQTPVDFAGPAVSNVTYSCTQVLDLSTGKLYTPQQLNIGCTFGSQSAPLPATVQVTFQTNAATQTGALTSPAGLFTGFWLGMPAIVLVGSLRGKKLTRKSILQLLGLLIVTIGLLQGIGCGGGGFKTPNTQNVTPTGFYQVQIVGTANNQTVTSAVVPLTVGH